MSANERGFAVFLNSGVSIFPSLTNLDASRMP
jgi:hypothetical protein